VYTNSDKTYLLEIWKVLSFFSNITLGNLKFYCKAELVFISGRILEIFPTFFGLSTAGGHRQT